MRFIICIIISLIMLAPHAECETSAESACVMNAVTGELVYEHNAEERLPMASTTKIVTLLTALERADPDAVVTVSAEAAAQEGSSAYIEEGDRITMRDLMYGLMLNSGNDAAVAIAQHVSGSCDIFVDEMNKTAKKAGAVNTSFKNPNGLESEGHYTTAHDLAVITRYAMRDERFAAIVSKRLYKAHITHPDGTATELEYINHNRLLKDMEGCIGVKTGYTKAAGRCLVSAAQRGGAEYIMVTLNDSNDWNTHKELVSEAFSGCRMVTAVEKGQCISHLASGPNSCALVAADSFEVPVNGKGKEIELAPHIPEGNVALNKGEKAGYIEVIFGGSVIGRVDVIADKDFYVGDALYRPCFTFYLARLIKDLL